MPRITQAQQHRLNAEAEAYNFFRHALMSLLDPRRRQGQRYPLHTVVVIALMAMVCGADDAQAMQYWGEAHSAWLEEVLDMPHGPPTQDVFLSVLGALDPKCFSEVFRYWADLLRVRLQGNSKTKKHIAIDGKTSRRSHDVTKGIAAIHTVSAYLTERGVVLAQTKTPDKSNEIKAIPELLDVIDIRQAVITIDAMGCQREIAEKIVEKGGDYLLGIKENQPTLLHDIQVAFQYAQRATEESSKTLPAPPIDSFEEIDKGHGRIEMRKIELIRDSSWLTMGEKWPSVALLVKVTRERTILKTDKTSQEISYYIGSDKIASAQEIANHIRGHWQIENNVHWILDIAFREDEARHRANNVAQNMATLRHFALNIIKNDKNRKLGVANTRKLAGWDNSYLIRLLTSADL